MPRTRLWVTANGCSELYVHPAVKDLGIMIGGWHDFRHTLATRFLKKWPTKVVSEILGHSDVHPTLVETEDFRAPLNELADELFS